MKTTFAKGNKAGRGGKRAGSGRKPKVIRQLEQDWKKDAKSSYEVMCELKRLALEAADEGVRVTACRSFMDRVHGKPRQAVDLALGSDDLADLYRGIRLKPQEYKALAEALKS